MKRLHKLLNLIKKKAFFKKKVKLSSGRISNYYIDARLITLDSEGLWLITKTIFSFIKKNKITCVGGPTLGADPIIGALLLYSKMRGYKLKGFIVRKERKSHGMKRLIEGEFPDKKDKVLIIDDVVTTGNSLLKVIEILKRKGIKIFGCCCIVDRQEGAQELLEKKKIPLFSIFTLSDLK